MKLNHFVNVVGDSCHQMWMFGTSGRVVSSVAVIQCLQCFDTVGLSSGRATEFLWKMNKGLATRCVRDLD